MTNLKNMILSVLFTSLYFVSVSQESIPLKLSNNNQEVSFAITGEFNEDYFQTYISPSSKEVITDFSSTNNLELTTTSSNYTIEYFSFYESNYDNFDLYSLDHYSHYQLDNAAGMDPNVSSSSTISISNNTVDFSYLEVNKDYIISLISTDSRIALFKLRLSSSVSTTKEKKTVSNTKIYPNPVTDNLTIEFETTNRDTPIEIYSTTGQLLFTDTDSRSPQQNKILIDFSNYSHGVYLVHIGDVVKKTIK